MNNRKLIGIIAVGIIAVGLITCNGPSQNEPKKDAASVETLTLGAETSLLTSTVWVAENKGYFKEEGIEVRIKDFSSGKAALAAMLNEGNLDMVTVAQTPVVFNSFNRNDYAIIAMMVSSDNDVKILARKDKGITTPSDLLGKKIGTTKGSTGHFFLGLFLVHNKLKLSDIEIIDVGASDLPQALAEGRVDAISTWEPHISTASNLLGENAILFQPGAVPGGSIFREDFYFVPNRSFLNKNPEALKRFLKAIKKGVEFVHKNREESINIVAQRLKIEKESIASLWDDFDFQLLLDQTLLITLEDEAKWAIENNLTNETQVPNYLNYIHIGALEAVMPEAVTIIR